MEEKKNIPTVEGEAITPEAPAADIPGTDAPSPDLTAGAPAGTGWGNGIRAR